jgi:hypothetical protein
VIIRVKEGCFFVYGIKKISEKERYHYENLKKVKE